MYTCKHTLKGVGDCFFSRLDCVYGVQSSMCSCLFFFKKRIIFHIIYLYSTHSVPSLTNASIYFLVLLAVCCDSLNRL